MVRGTFWKTGFHCNGKLDWRMVDWVEKAWEDWNYLEKSETTWLSQIYESIFGSCKAILNSCKDNSSEGIEF